MLTTRRRFLGALSVPAAAALAPSVAARVTSRGLDSLAASLASHTGAADAIARDEDFWAEVQRGFTVDRSVINLNNGGVSPSPAFVQEAMKRHLDFSNSHPPPVALWRILEPQKETTRARLAREWEVDPEEIAITRNASEGLQICQFGLDLKSGDEVLTTNQDYPRMLNTFRQREQREGITLRMFSIPVPAESDEALVRAFEERITPNTRLILMSHMINLTGQILPVRKIVDMARRYDIPVIVDGAHSHAHVHFTIRELGCDYVATSLHKWLFAPHGTELLYVRREKIRDLWPLMAASEDQTDDIRKFEEIGTHPAANHLAINEALTLHQAIGGERKEARMIFLRDYWANRLLAHDRVRLNTSLKPGYACGLANVRVEGVDSAALNNWLWSERHILTTAIQHDEFEGIRVTPSVYTTLEELDRFCDAVEDAIRRGVPG